MVVKSLKSLLILFPKNCIAFGICTDLLYRHCFPVLYYSTINVCCAITWRVTTWHLYVITWHLTPVFYYLTPECYHLTLVTRQVNYLTHAILLYTVIMYLLYSCILYSCLPHVTHVNSTVILASGGTCAALSATPHTWREPPLESSHPPGVGMVRVPYTIMLAFGHPLIELSAIWSKVSHHTHGGSHLLVSVGATSRIHSPNGTKCHTTYVVGAISRIQHPRSRMELSIIPHT